MSGARVSEHPMHYTGPQGALVPIATISPCQMSSAQQAAFRSANGSASNISEADTTLLIAGSASVLVLLWFAWVTLSAYKSWSRGGLVGVEAGSRVVRALFVLLLTLFIVGY